MSELDVEEVYNALKDLRKKLLTKKDLEKVLDQKEFLTKSEFESFIEKSGLLDLVKKQNIVERSESVAKHIINCESCQKELEKLGYILVKVVPHE